MDPAGGTAPLYGSRYHARHSPQMLKPNSAYACNGALSSSLDDDDDDDGSWIGHICMGQKSHALQFGTNCL